MTGRRAGGTLRGRVLMLVIGAGILPLVVLTAWLTLSVSQGGERLLRDRLQSALAQNERQIARRWVELRYHLLFISEDTIVQATLRGGGTPTTSLEDAIRQRFDRLPESVIAVSVADATGASVWSGARADSTGEATIDTDQPIYHRADGARVGALRSRLRLRALFPSDASAPGFDAIFGLVDRATGRSLLPLPFGASSALEPHFRWGDDEWVSERRDMDEPPLTLVAAGPITVLTAPFRAATLRTVMGLGVITGLALLVAALVSKRITQSLEELEAAAAAVAGGDLSRQVSVGGTTEVRSVAAAFNAMAGNLRSVMDLAAQREALAAVGSFATELAHEIRNPLGAMRLDLELVEERLPADSSLRTLQRNAIGEIERLDAAVGGALDLARSGRVSREPLSLVEPIRAAVHFATPRFEQHRAVLHCDVSDKDVVVHGDAHALQRLILNVLLNAADALAEGGRCEVTLARVDGDAVVRISDDGPGMDPGILTRAGGAFFSTKADGTGLGLAIASRIAHAHGGRLTIDSTPGAGTRVSLSIPLAERAGARVV